MNLSLNIIENRMYGANRGPSGKEGICGVFFIGDGMKILVENRLTRAWEGRKKRSYAKKSCNSSVQGLKEEELREKVV